MTRTDRPVTVGIVGLGGMGRRHANNVEDLGHEVVAGSDVSRAMRDQFANTFEVPVFEGFTELYDAIEPDAVVIATPNAFHAETTIEALERGIAVLTEKPLTTDLSAAKMIRGAASRTGAPAMVGFHNRFSSAMRMLDDYREADSFGDIVHIRADYIRRRGIPNVNSWFTDASVSGGGALIDIGVHTIDFAMAAADFPEPVSVSGVVRRLYADRPDYVDPEDWSNWGEMGGESIDVEDGATALVRCANDTTIAIEIAWARDREPSRTIHLQGTNGGARCALGDDRITMYGVSDAGTDHYVDSEMVDPTSPSSYHDEMAYFLDAVAEGREPEHNTIEQALTVQEIIHGIYESSSTGTEYRFDP